MMIFSYFIVYLLFLMAWVKEKLNLGVKIGVLYYCLIRVCLLDLLYIVIYCPKVDYLLVTPN